MMIYQEKIAPPDPLPDPANEPAEVLLSRRPTESLQQENSWLKARLAHILRKNK